MRTEHRKISTLHWPGQPDRSRQGSAADLELLSPQCLPTEPQRSWIGPNSHRSVIWIFGPTGEYFNCYCRTDLLAARRFRNYRILVAAGGKHSVYPHLLGRDGKGVKRPARRLLQNLESPLLCVRDLRRLQGGVVASHNRQR